MPREKSSLLIAEATESSLAMLILDIPAAAASNSTSRCSDSIDTSYAVRGGHGLSRGASRGDRRVWNQKLAGGTTVRSIRWLRGVSRAQLLAAVRTVFRAPWRLGYTCDTLAGKGLTVKSRIVVFSARKGIQPRTCTGQSGRVPVCVCILPF